MWALEDLYCYKNYFAFKVIFHGRVTRFAFVPVRRARTPVGVWKFVNIYHNTFPDHPEYYSPNKVGKNYLIMEKS